MFVIWPVGLAFWVFLTGAELILDYGCVDPDMGSEYDTSS
jgi:hypothetical protein